MNFFITLGPGCALKKLAKGLQAAKTLMDGWMICNFKSFSTVFQSYQDDGWIIMKGCVQWNHIYS